MLSLEPVGVVAEQRRLGSNPWGRGWDEGRCGGDLPFPWLVRGSSTSGIFPWSSSDTVIYLGVFFFLKHSLCNFTFDSHCAVSAVWHWTAVKTHMCADDWFCNVTTGLESWPCPAVGWMKCGMLVVSGFCSYTWIFWRRCMILLYRYFCLYSFRPPHTLTHFLFPLPLAPCVVLPPSFNPRLLTPCSLVFQVLSNSIEPERSNVPAAEMQYVNHDFTAGMELWQRCRSNDAAQVTSGRLGASRRLIYTLCVVTYVLWVLFMFLAIV